MKGQRRPGELGREALDRLPQPPGLCATCEHLELQGSKRSVFLRCALSDRNPAYPRYPRLPVLTCPGYTSIDPPADC